MILTKKDKRITNVISLTGEILKWIKTHYIFININKIFNQSLGQNYLQDKTRQQYLQLIKYDQPRKYAAANNRQRTYTPPRIQNQMKI